MSDYSIRESGSVPIKDVVLSAQSVRDLAKLAFEVIGQVRPQSAEDEEQEPFVRMVALKRFETCIKSLPPQRKISKLQRYAVAAVVWVSFGLFGAGLGFLFATIGRTTRHGQFDWNPVAIVIGSVFCGICLFGGELAALSGFEKLPTLYPSVEIQTGPEHLNVQKVRRERLGRYTAFFAIPLPLGIVAGIVDTLILKL